ncbi:hypothetical protein [Burkholderia pseudomallei]|uniref:hypothetical protein n=1 Tax=Burkholderia pseudomallei TaxID=28450 RepID=UPI000A1A1392|nr:hypothetical protein [Burkholderia pseudomallei]ARK46290.1 hypothetical protein BOC35_08145 [Burkholderia pseudomallei]RPE05149.1 hypothetical protein DF127_36310 [Burkholderia pseudomallei]RPE15329.1 hypothetical protein DF068_36080 [Burkholderia pseudomallei]RQS80834.1 hypothetical protein DF125_36225 [Burkholderia pseudomallei]RQZ42061.1 hypothetical protein DF060_36320 [Burkholderia pseudomallei]
MDQLQTPTPLSAGPAILTAELAAIVNSIHIGGTIDNLSVCRGKAIAFIRVAGSCGAGSMKSYASEDTKAKKLPMMQGIEWPLDVGGGSISARL